MEYVETVEGIEFGETVEGIFERRINRFCCSVQIGGVSHLTHLSSSGRMEELLIKGCLCRLRPRSGKHRKTAFDLLLIRYEGIWVCLDSTLPNTLVNIWLKERLISLPWQYSQHRSEFSWQGSRYDFFLTGQQNCLMEVKSVTLVEDGVAKFPDAPTKRGSKHLQGLIAAKEQGWKSAVIFVIQRSDGNIFRPNTKQDPVFSRLLVEAQKTGVAIGAYNCHVNVDGSKYKGPIPVLLEDNL